MTAPDPFDAFVESFFALFTRRVFKGADFATYLQRNAGARGNEASVVDNAITGPLLALLGFAPAELRHLLKQCTLPEVDGCV